MICGRCGAELTGEAVQQDGVWLHRACAPQATAAGTPIVTAAPTKTTPMVPVLLALFGGMAVVGGVFAVAAGGKSAAPTVTVAQPAAVAPPDPPVRSEADQMIDRLSAASTLDAAMAIAKPMMDDTANKTSAGALGLAMWGAMHMTWADVGVAKDETTFALVRKDSDEARGKRLCTSGTIVQIEVQKLAIGKLHEGLMMSNAGNIFHFLNVGSSGSLVQRSSARACGVVVGTYDYSNSGGGVGHAVQIVGMFDLPENRATVAAPTAGTPPSGMTRSAAAAPDCPSGTVSTMKDGVVTTRCKDAPGATRAPPPSDSCPCKPGDTTCETAMGCTARPVAGPCGCAHGDAACAARCSTK